MNSAGTLDAIARVAPAETKPNVDPIQELLEQLPGLAELTQQLFIGWPELEELLSGGSFGGGKGGGKSH